MNPNERKYVIGLRGEDCPVYGLSLSKPSEKLDIGGRMTLAQAKKEIEGWGMVIYELVKVKEDSAKEKT